MPDFIPVLSDHAYQSRVFQMFGPQGELIVELAVGTWNMLDQGFSKASHYNKEYSNNPYDADETLDNYNTRKRAQFLKLKQNIGQMGDDIVLMQEIDFLISHPDLKSEFITMLDEHGYNLIITHMLVDPNFSQQPMALIYNREKLCWSANNPLFLSPPTVFGKQKFRGYESVFIHTQSQQMIAVANLHLLYDLDYRLALQWYQTNAVQQGVLSIMGGDINNAPKSFLDTLCDASIATNFSLDPSTGKLTIYEATAAFSEHRRPKAYDRFFGAVPPMFYLRSQITCRCEQILIDTDGNAVFSPIVKPCISSAGSDVRKLYFFKQECPEENLWEAFLKRVDGCDSLAQLEQVTQQIKADSEYQKFVTENVEIGFDLNPVLFFEQICEEKRSALIGYGPEISSAKS